MNPQALRKIKEDIARQGFATVVGNGWHHTVGMAAKGFHDVIVPNRIGGRHFATLMQEYANGKFVLDTKHVTDAVMINSILGHEPIRLELRPISQKDSAIFAEQLCSGVFEHFDFKGFKVLSLPDNDNRLFGEEETRVTAAPEAWLLDQVFHIAEQIAQKKIDEEQHREHAKKLLAQPITPRRRLKKSGGNTKPRYTKNRKK